MYVAAAPCGGDTAEAPFSDFGFSDSLGGTYPGISGIGISSSDFIVDDQGARQEMIPTVQCVGVRISKEGNHLRGGSFKRLREIKFGEHVVLCVIFGRAKLYFAHRDNVLIPGDQETML